MILLALDASTTAVGWALFADGEYVDSGVWVPPRTDWVSRVTYIQNIVWDAPYQFDFDDIGLEIATGNRGNMATNRKLGAVEYVIREFCRAQHVPIHEVTASQVKATGCHKHRLDIAEAIAGRPLDKRRPGDEADAIGVALAVERKAREEEWGNANTIHRSG